MRPSVDLRNWASPIEDQLDLGSCTSNAFAGAYELMTKRLKSEDYVDVSRLFLYYNIRVIDGTVGMDAGGYLRDGVKAMSKYGLCEESIWPYDIAKFDVKPSDAAYKDARTRSITNYQRVDGFRLMLDAINNNRPIAFGMDVYRVFDYIGPDDPVIPMPNNNEHSSGGHAMCMVGYDLAKKQFLVRNSYGTEWGDRGYAWLPFEYVEKYAYDAWVFDLSDHLVN